MMTMISKKKCCKNMMVSILDPFQQIVHMPEVVHSELKPLKKLHDRHPKRKGESSSTDFFMGELLNFGVSTQKNEQVVYLNKCHSTQKAS